MNLNNMNQKKPKHSLPFFSGSSSKGKKKSTDEKPVKSFGKKRSTRTGSDSTDRDFPKKSPGTAAYRGKERTERSNAGTKRFDARQKFTGNKKDSPKEGNDFRPRTTSAFDKPFKRRTEEEGRAFKKRPSGATGTSISGNRPNRRNDFADRFDPEKNKTAFSDKPKREYRNKPDSNARPARQRKFDDDFSPETTGTTSRSRTSPSRAFSGESKWDKGRKSDRPAIENQGNERVKRPRRRTVDAPAKAISEEIRLNKYISNSGVCSRREADTLIISGVVTVNGKIITELGHKIKPHDIVHCGGDLITNEKKVYLLLNKPKDYITTVTDPGKRKTVMELVADACRERIYPVGRLDRNTTGLLLFTNDGELAKKLTHPRYGIEKIYHVELSMPLAKMDLDAIRKGINLEDGPVQVDEINYVEFASTKKEVGIKLHSGKNRVVRRIFESLGYKVLKLDRVVFAGLTKKDLARGRWRFLSGAEVSKLYALA